MRSPEQQRAERSSRMAYLHRTYGGYLDVARVLDVGADECHLKQYLGSHVDYVGIGMGGHPDIEFDLDSGPLPFEDGAFDCVVCTEVLEHLEQIHHVFDELCRVATRHVILSLPNPCGGWLNRLVRHSRYDDYQTAKFYGLPRERPSDRHRWFYDADEAERFVVERSAQNGFRVCEQASVALGMSRRERLATRLRRRLVMLLLSGSTNPSRLANALLWFVLERV